MNRGTKEEFYEDGSKREDNIIKEEVERAIEDAKNTSMDSMDPVSECREEVMRKNEEIRALKARLSSASGAGNEAVIKRLQDEFKREMKLKEEIIKDLKAQVANEGRESSEYVGKIKELQNEYDNNIAALSSCRRDFEDLEKKINAKNRLIEKLERKKEFNWCELVTWLGVMGALAGATRMMTC